MSKNDSIDALFGSFLTSTCDKPKRGRPRIHPEGTTDKRKQSLYFPESMVEELTSEAKRLDRSMSWVVQKAWKIAKAEIAALPSATSESDND